MSILFGQLPGAPVHYGFQGLGVLGSVIRAATATGESGPGPLANDLTAADDAKEIRWVIETAPTVGSLIAYEDGSLTVSNLPPGSTSFSYRLYADGVDLGVATATITVGAVVAGVSVVVAATCQHITTVSASVVVNNQAPAVAVTVAITLVHDLAFAATVTLSTQVVPVLALVQWSTMARNIIMDVPDCPTFTMEDALHQAATDFYRDTRAWRVENVLLTTTVAGQAQYLASGTPPYAMLIGLPAVWIDGREVDELPVGGADQYRGATNTRKVGVDSGISISVVPAPDLTGQPITATAAYAPGEDAPGIGLTLYRDHHDAIEAAALAKLLGMRGKPWSDPNAALSKQREADTLAMLASTQAGPQRRRAALRVQAL